MPTALSTRALKDDIAFVEAQLRQHSDPYDTARLMWQQRYEELVEQLKDLQQTLSTRAEVALMFDGNPVRGTSEINLGFATKVLDHYQAFVGALASERAGADVRVKGQLPRSFGSKLFIKDMVRGSVGFLLREPEGAQGSLLPSLLSEAVDDATHALSDLASEDLRKFEARVESLSPRAVSAVKKIVKTLNEAAAVIKIADSSEELRLDERQIASINERLNELEILESSEVLTGVLLGIFPERQQYEFRIGEDGPVIHGPISEDLTQHYLTDFEFFRSILLKPIRAKFLKVTKVLGGRSRSEQMILDNFVE